MSRTRNLPGLVGWLALSLVAAAVGGVASVNAGGFYTSLDRPGWAPPPSLFGPVWTILYVLIAVAAWLVWKQGGFAAARGALTVYLVQLAANALWTWIFFAWRQGALAFAEILVLWVLIVVTVVLFWRVSRVAALLMLPYLAWVSYASALTWSVWQRNPEILG